MTTKMTSPEVTDVSIKKDADQNGEGLSSDTSLFKLGIFIVGTRTHASRLLRCDWWNRGEVALRCMESSCDNSRV